MRRLLIAALAVLTLNLSMPATAPAQSDNDAGRIAKVKRAVDKIGVEENVSVRYLDGSKAKGRIKVIGDSSFVLVNKKTSDATTINYAQVKRISRGDDNALSDPGMWIGIAMIPVIVGLCLWARNKD